jgi:hypothetical protein
MQPFSWRTSKVDSKLEDMATCKRETPAARLADGKLANRARQEGNRDRSRVLGYLYLLPSGSADSMLKVLKRYRMEAR